ncbi:restriction endonuclease subunit S [Ruminococcus flavefaciens]|uniref:restriction endonuclease subunit S n=1 Tax=Ruminococcus flavefaciens TaxID=1265 RepID=UPI0026EF8920|nr:restriction endonuclease subunit S [Ruminococcus flavefaciens]
MPYAFCEQIGKEIRDISDEIPFDIPDSWEWVHLDHIAVSDLGKTLDKAKNTGEFQPYLCSINVYWNGIDLTKLKEARFEESELPKYLLKKGDLLICEGGEVGRCCVWDKEIPMYYQNALHRVRFYGNINPYYFKYLMELYKGIGTIEAYSKGVTIKHLVQKSLNSIYFPLPPLAEQHRIVAKIEELLPFIEKYGKAEEHLTALNATFPEALKKSILQEAVQGRLVPQNPDDEPASVLLERIRAEKQALIKVGKIKKEKHESVIVTRDKVPYEIIDGKERCIADEVPFEIPDNWCWCRLGTIFQHNTGKALNSSNHQGTKMQYITTSNLYWDRFELDKLKEMLFTETEVEKCTVRKDDLLVCEGGDIGRAAIWNFDYPMRIQNHIHRLRPYAPVEMYFFYYVFYLYKKAGLIGGKGIGIQGLSSNAIDQLFMPLPPLSEQKRIVAKIEELTKYCDKL